MQLPVCTLFLSRRASDWQCSHASSCLLNTTAHYTALRSCLLIFSPQHVRLLQVSMRQLAKRFSSLGQEALGGFVGALVAQGVLAGVPGARNAYRDGPAAANGNANASQQVVSSLG